MTVILRADCIGKRFGGATVLNAATLRAVAGTVTYLVGRNGCGKSTLLRVAAGVLVPNSGVVSFKDRFVPRPRWHRMAREGFAYLPDRELLSPSRTVRFHLETVRRQFRLPGYGSAVERCGVGPLLDRACGTLSEGERRRVEVATVAVARPACLLADEPYRNLDPADREIIAGVIRQLANEGCAVVVTGHEVEELLRSVDAVVWCTDRTTYELGTPREALAHWRFVSAYIGPIRADRLVRELSGRAKEETAPVP